MAGGYAVDTFFLLRLTPIYMIVLMFFTCLHTYLGDGPLWPNDVVDATNCKKYWWTNLLYINNVVEVDNMCMGWTWYLSNDMQFYFISPIFLLAMFYLMPLGIILTAGLIVTGIACTFYFDYTNGGVDIFTMKEEDSKYWKEVYVPPWCRVAPYAVGMFLGFIIYKTKQTTLAMRKAVVGWVITWIVGVFLCYITYTERKEGGTPWTVVEHSFYESFGRPCWAMCVGWIIYACYNNRGGFINSILSWEGFLPLSRLTYAAYLIHPVVMMLHLFSKKALIYIDDMGMVYLFMGHTVTAFLAAFLLSVSCEAPALALEKMAFRLR
nr:hypothetical protein BaRGS_022744 [Batillaria attramentaria]